MSSRPAQISAVAMANSRVSGRPVNGSPPPCFGGVFGGGLSNVTPSTDGDTDGLVVVVPPTPGGPLVVPVPVPVSVGGVVVPPPGGGLVVPPPGGGLVVPPPGGGLVGLLLAGHVLSLGVVVGSWVVLKGIVPLPPGNGTMTMPAVKKPLGGLDGTAPADDRLPSALAFTANAIDAPTASIALKPSRPIRTLLRGATRGPTSSLTAATAVPFFARDGARTLHAELPPPCHKLSDLRLVPKP